MGTRMVLVALCLLCSCSVLKRKGSWGKDAFFPVKAEAIRKAFVKNATSPHVYVPVASAGVIHVMAWDNKISHWVNKERTVFNEQHEADNYSDNLNTIQLYEMYLSILAPPSNDEKGSLGAYAMNKLKGGLLTNVSASASRVFQHRVRSWTNRRRPNAKDFNSMPSGHATEAGARRVLTARNLSFSGWSQNIQNGINGMNTMMSLAVMWARVEGKRHYPTDVLLGYSLGNFVSGFIYDSLINFDPDTSVGIAPLNGGASATLTFRF